MTIDDNINADWIHKFSFSLLFLHSVALVPFMFVCGANNNNKSDYTAIVFDFVTIISMRRKTEGKIDKHNAREQRTTIYWAIDIMYRGLFLMEINSNYGYN